MKCRCCFGSFEESEPNIKGFVQCPHCLVWRHTTFDLDRQTRVPETRLPDILKKSVDKFIPIFKEIEAALNIEVHSAALFDICCGIGGSMYLAKSRGWARVLGCDLNEHHAQVAKQYYNVEVITAEFESLTDLDCNWTCVLLHHGIEHCRYPRIVLNNVSEMLVPGGLIYLAHPHSVCAEDMESGGHVHEWSYDSFANMLYWYPQFKVLNSGYSGRAQFWFLRKD